MTSTFTVGEPVPFAAEAIPLGEGRATATPDGTQIVVRVESPDPATCASVDHGLVALGVHIQVEADLFTYLVEVGVAGEPGHLEARAVLDISAVVGDDVSLDMEFALCDRSGVVQAVRRFEGLLAPALDGRQ